MLCEIFIIKSTYNLLGKVIAPFLECETQEKARSYLLKMKKHKSISPEIYTMLFKRGIINIIPKRYRWFLVPEDERELKKMTKLQKAIEGLNEGPQVRWSFDDDSSSRQSLALPAVAGPTLMSQQERQNIIRSFS